LQAKSFAFYALATNERNYNTDAEQLIFLRDIDIHYSNQVHAILCSLKGLATGEALFPTVKKR